MGLTDNNFPVPVSSFRYIETGSRVTPVCIYNDTSEWQLRCISAAARLVHLGSQCKRYTTQRNHIYLRCRWSVCGPSRSLGYESKYPGSIAFSLRRLRNRQWLRRKIRAAQQCSMPDHIRPHVILSQRQRDQTDYRGQSYFPATRQSA